MPIGITSQSIEDIKEMARRLKINFDILSDYNLSFAKSLKLPTFSVDSAVYIKRLTLIVDNYKIVKVFYPVFPSDKHINDVLNWLKENLCALNLLVVVPKEKVVMAICSSFSCFIEL